MKKTTYFEKFFILKFFPLKIIDVIYPNRLTRHV